MSDDIIKRLREAIAEHPLSPIHGYAADITALLDRLKAAEEEIEHQQDTIIEQGRKLREIVNLIRGEPAEGCAHSTHDAVDLVRGLAMHIDQFAAAAERECERLREDAERYRWLRGDSCPDHSIRWTQWDVRCWVAPFWSGDLRREGLDRSIDAARAAEQKEGKK